MSTTRRSTLASTSGLIVRLGELRGWVQAGTEELEADR